MKINGKKLIQYTLDTTNELMKDKTHDWLPFISTDNSKISEYCYKQGFMMEYTRPESLASDNSSIIEAIWDALKWLNQKKNIIPDAILLLQPTSPLRKTIDIINAINKIKNENTISIVSVTRMIEHPYDCIVANKDEWSYLSRPKSKAINRQDYNDNYFFIGEIVFNFL